MITRLIRIFQAVVLVCACLGLSGNLGQPARAANLTVTKFTDSNDGACDADCSLREAVIAANATPEEDTIVLSAGTYSLTLNGPLDITAAAGDLDIHNPLTITGAGAGLTIIDAAGLNDPADRVFDVLYAGNVTLSQLSIVNGTANDGGGIRCDHSILTLNDVILSQNTAAPVVGGGMSSFSCQVTVNHSYFLNNYAEVGGGGLYANDSEVEINYSLISANQVGENSGGGGIYMSGARVTLNESSVTKNSARVGGGLYMDNSTSMLLVQNSLVAENLAAREGGGIAALVGRSLTIQSSTISGNIANTYGGGVDTRIPTYIAHSTIANNVADADIDNDGGAGGLLCYSSTCIAEVYVSIIADNIDHAAIPFHDCRNWNGVVSSKGFNLVEHQVEAIQNCEFVQAWGDVTGEDPRLAPLGDNGGPTLTHALRLGSPAVDRGTNSACPATDQRGEPRPLDGDGDGTAVCDIGAFETPRLWGTFLPVIMR